MARPSSVRRDRTRVLKAMAHPSRLLVLETLAGGERCVCDLQRVVGSDLSTVSKHLTLMREAGLLAHRRDGLQVFYRLRVPCVMDFFDCVDAVLGAPQPGSAGRSAHGGGASTACCAVKARR
jgi:DNA-binding transcriptional ArsR family regulator